MSDEQLQAFTEYTPTTDEVRNNMALGVAVAQACADDGHPELPQDINWPTGSVRPAVKRQFDAWLTAHDKALREQIAREYGIGDLTSRPLRDAQDEISRLESLVRYLRRENRRLENTIAREKDQTDE